MAGSRSRRLAKFSSRCARASGVYGIVPPSTTPRPPGTAPSAPSSRTGLKSAEWGSTFQCALFSACQIPFRSGVPSAVRGAV